MGDARKRTRLRIASGVCVGLLGCGLALPEPSLTFRAARPAGPRTRARVDLEIGTRQPMAMLAMRKEAFHSCESEGLGQVPT
jgi:hypothetical protein